MLSRKSCAFIICTCMFAIVLSDNEYEIPGIGGIKIKCSKKGAKIEVYRDLENGGASGKITIIFYELNEVDANGQSVSDQSGEKDKNHYYNDFNQQDFNAINLGTVILPNTNGTVNGSCYSLSAQLQGLQAVTFTVRVCSTLNSGILYLDDEHLTLSGGLLKFSIDITGWQWMTNGAYLDMKINVKIPPGRAMKEEEYQEKQPKKFSFGLDSVATFSTKVLIDGIWRNMAGGYPKYEQHGANNYITIRLPRFSNKAEYDPTVDPGYKSASPSLRPFYLCVTLAFLSFAVTFFSSAA